MVTDKKRIQTYVSDSTYESLKSLARDREMSLSKLTGEILRAYSIVDNSSNSTSNDCSCLTEDQLVLILDDFRYQLISDIDDLKAQNEERSKSERIGISSFRGQKRKKKGFAK